MKKVILIFSLLAGVSFGAVIQGDAIIKSDLFGTPPQGEAYFIVTSPSACWMQIFKSAPNEFYIVGMGIAEVYDLFLVNFGDQVTPDFVNTETSFLNFYGHTPTREITVLPGEQFYLAYWDQGSGPPDSVARDDDFFGWALMKNSGGALTVVSSATAVGGGIKVGTLEQIPEPTTSILFGVALTGFLLSRTRRS